MSYLSNGEKTKTRTWNTSAELSIEIAEGDGTIIEAATDKAIPEWLLPLPPNPLTENIELIIVFDSEGYYTPASMYGGPDRVGWPTEGGDERTLDVAYLLIDDQKVSDIWGKGGTMHSHFQALVRQGRLLPFLSYDKIVVSFSGGKDSMAMILFLIEMGVPLDKIEIWHQHVDGDPRTLVNGSYHGWFDWPVTAEYVKVTAACLGIELRSQWRDGGLQGELYRENSLTRGVWYEGDNGEFQYLPPSPHGKKNTRRRWPAKSASLQGKAFPAAQDSELSQLAMGSHYPKNDFFVRDWKHPVGAFRQTAGPS